MSDGMIVLNTPDQINAFQMLRLRSALKLEMLGLKNSRGSVYAYIKRFYNLKGNKQKVYDQFSQMCVDNGYLKAEKLTH